MPQYQPNKTRLDGINWHAHALVEKFNEPIVSELTEYLGHEPNSADFTRLGIEPDDRAEADSNLLTTAGLNRITNLIIGGGGTAFGNTTGRTGTGNSTTAAAVGNTDLQAAAGSANRWFQIMDATYPQQSNGVITAKSTYASADGNYAWEEWCWDIGTATVTSGNTVNANMLNRKVASLGTKASGASWVFTTTVTLS